MGFDFGGSRNNSDEGRTTFRPEDFGFQPNPEDAALPVAPEFANLSPSDVSRQAQRDLAGLQGLPALQREALRQGPSLFSRLATQQQTQQEAGALDNLRQSAGGQFAQAQGQLASRRGLSGGASERLAGLTVGSGLAQQQQLRRAGLSNRLGIRSQDETNRLQSLGQLPGAELAKIGVSQQSLQFDAGQSLTAQQADIQNALTKFGIEGQIIGAKQLADATEAAGKK